MLIGVEDLGVTLLLRDLDGHDLGLELALGNRFRRVLLAAKGDLILHFAGDTVFFGHVLGGDTHMDVIHRTPQAVFDHLIDEGGVAHAVTGAGLGNQVGSQAHVLHTTRHDHLGIAGFDLGSGLVHAFHARAAHDVKSVGRDFFGQAGGDSGFAGRVLTQAGLQHVPHDDFLDVTGIDAGSLHGFLDCKCAQIGGGNIGQGAKVTTDRSARGTEDHDFAGHGECSFLHGC